MRFSFPELPGDHKPNKEKGSYEALLAKLGRTAPSAETNDGNPKDSNDTSGKEDPHVPLTLSFGNADKCYEVDEQEANAAEAAMPPQLPKPARIIATFLSWVMVPLVMPVVSCSFMLWLSELDALPGKDKLIILLVTAGLNTVLPMLLIGLLKLIGIVRDIGLNSRRERLLPYVITIAGLALTVIYLRHLNAPSWMWSTYVGAAVASGICCVVNMWWKISAHATGVAGVIATLIVIGMYGHMEGLNPLRWWLAGSCLLAGLMGSARVFLRRHTDLQVIIGYICGFCCVLLAAIIIN